MEINHKRKYEQLKIYINGLIHLNIKLLDLLGFQTWIHGEKEYFVEYYYKDGSKITTAYGEKDIWEKVLKIIEEI